MEYCTHALRGDVPAEQRVIMTMPSLHMNTPATMHIHARCAAADGSTAAEQRGSGMQLATNITIHPERYSAANARRGSCFEKAGDMLPARRRWRCNGCGKRQLGLKGF